jgi:hypothetical protein
MVAKPLIFVLWILEGENFPKNRKNASLTVRNRVRGKPLQEIRVTAYVRKAML